TDWPSRTSTRTTRPSKGAVTTDRPVAEEVMVAGKVTRGACSTSRARAVFTSNGAAADAATDSEVLRANTPDPAAIANATAVRPTVPRTMDLDRPKAITAFFTCKCSSQKRVRGLCQVNLKAT